MLLLCNHDNSTISIQVTPIMEIILLTTNSIQFYTATRSINEQISICTKEASNDFTIHVPCSHLLAHSLAMFCTGSNSVLLEGGHLLLGIALYLYDCANNYMLVLVKSGCCFATQMN